MSESESEGNEKTPPAKVASESESESESEGEEESAQRRSDQQSSVQVRQKILAAPSSSDQQPANVHKERNTTCKGSLRERERNRGRGFNLHLNNFTLAIVLCQLCVINRGLDLT